MKHLSLLATALLMTANLNAADLPTPPDAERQAHEVEIRPLQVFQRRHREIALRPVDHLAWNHVAGDILEDALAAAALDAPPRAAPHPGRGIYCLYNVCVVEAV